MCDSIISSIWFFSILANLSPETLMLRRPKQTGQPRILAGRAEASPPAAAEGAPNPWAGDRVTPRWAKGPEGLRETVQLESSQARGLALGGGGKPGPPRELEKDEALVPLPSSWGWTRRPVGLLSCRGGDEKLVPDLCIGPFPLSCGRVPDFP